MTQDVHVLIYVSFFMVYSKHCLAHLILVLHILTKGHDEGGWYHESFVRGSPNKLKDMIRTKIKGTKIKSASTMISDLTEPNFYNLPSSMPSTTQADELPEPSFERNNSCSGVSVGSNESVHGSNMDVVVGTHRAVLSKSRRVSVEQAV